LELELACYINGVKNKRNFEKEVFLEMNSKIISRTRKDSSVGEKVKRY